MATTLKQTFDGGTHGAAVTWESTEVTGAPVWLAGAGTAMYDTAVKAHGTGAARVTNTAGNNAPLVFGLPAGTVEVSGHAYYLLPATRPSISVLYIATPGSGIEVVTADDGAVQVYDWNASLGSSAAGVLPAAGTWVRIAFTLTIAATSTLRVGVYAADATTALWELTTAVTIPGGDTIENVQFGLQGSQPTAVPIVVDTIRVDHGTGAAAAFLPPELAPATRKHQVWFRTPSGWRNIGTGRVVAAT